MYALIICKGESIAVFVCETTISKYVTDFLTIWKLLKDQSRNMFGSSIVGQSFEKKICNHGDPWNLYRVIGLRVFLHPIHNAAY
jgi:hypothetical protein